MIAKIKKAVFMSCKEATMAVSKREEHVITFSERLRLFLHLLICKFCRAFVAQSKFFAKHTANLYQHKHLSFAAKAKLEEMIKDKQ